MEFKSFDYNSIEVKKSNSKERKEFNKNTRDKNIIYFFYKDDECLYIGESKKTLHDRCFKNTPKHSEKNFFIQSNKIRIIVLETCVGDFERQTLEKNFILAFFSAGHPLHNEKA